MASLAKSIEFTGMNWHPANVYEQTEEFVDAL
jgi:hypothetical protein